MRILTARDIRLAAGPSGLYKSSQLKAIGLRWPPKPGWMDRAVGREMTDDEYARFMRGADPDPPLPGDGLYCDGGCIVRNPSPHGGTWAYCSVLDGRVAEEASGLLTPTDIGLPAVSNNVSELAAAVYGLKRMPDRWSGVVYTDSSCTLLRIRQSPKQAKMNGVPPKLAQELFSQKNRLGRYKVVLLGGHPTSTELAAGLRTNGLPVSRHNVACDEACNLEAEQFLAKLREFAR